MEKCGEGKGGGEIMNSDSNECRGFNKPFLINRW